MQTPYATHMQADFKAEKIGNTWVSVGTVFGETSAQKFKSKAAAEKNAAMMNANAVEAAAGNAAYIAERNAQAASIKAARAEKRAMQSSFAF